MIKSYTISLPVLLFQAFSLGFVVMPIQASAAQLLHQIQKENKTDFKDFGATSEFVKYVWLETIKEFPDAAKLDMPDVYFTDRDPQELGEAVGDIVFGFYDNSEDIIVIFPQTHIFILGVDPSIDRDDSKIAASSIGKKDIQALIGITLIHEFRHYILSKNKRIRSARQHLDMIADENLYRLMRRISKQFTDNTEALLIIEKSILQASVLEDIRK